MAQSLVLFPNDRFPFPGPRGGGYLQTAGGEDWGTPRGKDDQRRGRIPGKWSGEVSVTKQWRGDRMGRGSIDTSPVVQDHVE